MNRTQALRALQHVLMDGVFGDAREGETQRHADQREAQEVLDQGGWANGELIADNERPALEFLAGDATT